jgi:hypothetical protein
MLDPDWRKVRFRKGMIMSAKLSKELLEIMACPKCKTPVVQEEDSIQCTNKECRLRYPIRDGIPIMLIEEAKPYPS